MVLALAKSSLGRRLGLLLPVGDKNVMSVGKTCGHEKDVNLHTTVVLSSSQAHGIKAPTSLEDEKAVEYVPLRMRFNI